MTAKAKEVDLNYLRERATGLKEHERIVTLMVDEEYPAQRIEYTNGSFTGLTEEGRPAKTVLAFMVQSLFDKYKDGSLQPLLDHAKVNTKTLNGFDPYSLLPGWLHAR